MVLTLKPGKKPVVAIARGCPTGAWQGLAGMSRGRAGVARTALAQPGWVLLLLVAVLW